MKRIVLAGFGFFLLVSLPLALSTSAYAGVDLLKRAIGSHDPNKVENVLSNASIDVNGETTGWPDGRMTYLTYAVQECTNANPLTRAHEVNACEKIPELLIKHGANVDGKSSAFRDTFTALMYAVYMNTGHGIAQFLLDHGANGNAYYCRKGRLITALDLAAGLSRSTQGQCTNYGGIAETLRSYGSRFGSELGDVCKGN